MENKTFNERVEKRFQYVMKFNDSAKNKLETSLDFFESGWKNASGYVRPVKRSLTSAFNALPKDGSVPFNVFFDIWNARHMITDNDHYIEPNDAILDIEEIANIYVKEYFPIRVVLRFNDDGSIEGLCEDSFSMSWSTERVQVYWSGKAYSILGEHILDAQRDSEYNAKKYKNTFVFNPFDKLCPVKIDVVRWLNDMCIRNKYGARNAIFVKKLFEVDEEDACLA
jgi:hypothetical protein